MLANQLGLDFALAYIAVPLGLPRELARQRATIIGSVELLNLHLIAGEIEKCKAQNHQRELEGQLREQVFELTLFAIAWMFK